MRIRRAVVLTAALLLAGCSGERPGGGSAEEDRQLDAAAASLDANSVATDADEPAGNAGDLNESTAR